MSRRATASSFANWVYDLYHPKVQSPDGLFDQAERLRQGRQNHTYIDIFLRQAWTLNWLGDERNTGWHLWFADTHMKPERIFQASCLMIDGEPLKCIPDLIFHNEQLNEYIVVERKTTRVPSHLIPKDGWPNLQAQLWCYSHIDDFDDASSVFLVGQMWRQSSGCLELMQSHPNWRRGISEHESRCSWLFSKYGGIYQD